MFSVAPVAPRLWWHDIYLADDLQNPHIVIPIWQDTHLIATQVLGIVMLHKEIVVYVKYKQGSTGFEYDIRFMEQI